MVVGFPPKAYIYTINILRQCLQAAGTKESPSWYLSPIEIVFSFISLYKQC